MKIEVLMAVYNGEKFIAEQLHSILNQTEKDLHIIIRDNFSEDNTVKIVQNIAKAYPDRITLICSPQNDGVIGNFAALMQKSQAKYIMFSDADDTWHKDKVEKTFAKFNKLEKLYGKETPLLVHTDLIVTDRDLNPTAPSFWKFSHLNIDQGHALNRLLVQNVITGCTVMVNRALLEAAMPIPEGIVMHDWWLGLNASGLGHVGTVSEATMLYRQHGGNDTGAKKYGVISYFKRALDKKQKKKISENIQKRFNQAKALLEKHKANLKPNQIATLEAFIKMQNASFFQKRYLMAKYGLYKHGFLRNTIEFLPLDWFWK
jgi:glycosyltransferase involved in cell wall biosynthesis